MADCLNKPKNEVKQTLLSLISQSFQTNLNLMAYMEKAGIELSESEWQTVLGTEKKMGKNSVNLRTLNEPLISSLCKDSKQLDKLMDVKSRLNRNNNEIRMIKAQLQKFEEIGGTDFFMGEQLSLLEADEDLPQKIIEIEAQVHKLQTFESTHLDSRKLLPSLHRLAD